MSIAAGSYVLHALTHPEQECERLERQAGALWDEELAFLREAGLRSGARVLDLVVGRRRGDVVAEHFPPGIVATDGLEQGLEVEDVG